MSKNTIAARSPFDLAGKNAIVTGGGSGIGFGIAKSLVDAGAKVMIVGQQEAKLQQAVAELGDRSAYQVADITDEKSVEALVQATVAKMGSIEILVNNAGNHIKKPIPEMSVEDVQTVLDVHVLAAYSLTKHVSSVMDGAAGCSILYIASMASYLSIPNIIGYTTAKSAVLGLVRGSAAELSPDGIRVNGIAPGWIETPMSQKALAGDPERKQKILSRTPMARFGDPSDIGHAAAYLASDAAGFVNGHVLAVDGGAVSGF